MTISNDLFLAILAMDAYNRGYGRGLDVTGNQLGNAVLGASSDVREGSPERAASFFAQAYTWNGEGNGRTVISRSPAHQPMRESGGAAAYVIGSPT